MQDSSKATSRTRRRPVAAFLAVTLAFALAFMAFEPSALRSAFANEGEAAEADAAYQEVGGEQATEPAEAEPAGEADAGAAGDDAVTGEEPAPEAEAPMGEEAPADVAASVPDGTGDGTDARAGPEGEETVQAEAEAPSESQPKARATFASATVTFYSNAASENPSILARKLVSAKAGQTVTVDVSDVSANPPTSAQVFDGWLYGGATHADSIVIDPQDGNVRLYPAFSSGHWLGYTVGDAGNGAVEVASQFVDAADPAPTTLPTTTREGYAFDGWFEGSMDGGIVSYGERVTDADGAVLDPAALKAMLEAGDVELYAQWTGSDTTYRVLIWHENPDDNEYSYQGSDTVGDDPGERAVSGEMTAVEQMPEIEGFTLQTVGQAVIEGDGSTVVHALYNRNTYSIYFHDSKYSNGSIIDDLTITAKYGANIQTKWPQSTPETTYISSWYTLPYDHPAFKHTYVNGISTMPLGGADFYKKDTGKMKFSTIFKIQNVDGSNDFTTYMTQLFGAANAPGTTPDDYMPIKGFMVNASSAHDAELIRGNPMGDPAATHDSSFAVSTPVGASYDQLPVIPDEYGTDRFTSTFYYLRCQYDIVFEENGGPEVADVEGVYYDSPLEGLSPSDYVVGETTYAKPNGEAFEFEGWYENSELAGNPFDFASAKMPAGNVVLYAKWKPVQYLVQVDPAGGEFVSDVQSTYFWVDHGDTVGYIDAERHYVADDDGTHVYDYEAYSTDDDDDFGNADYVVARPGESGQRYSYSQDAYSLFGWYKVEGDARALVPFDFGEPITEDTSIVARWQAAGMYDIAYDPTVDVAGVTVSGDIDTMLDAGYADLSPTVIMNTPVNIEATDGDEYEFLGWQVVENFDEGADVLVDALYQEGDGFVVDSELASDNTIYLQALYEETADNPDDPDAPADPDEPGTTVDDPDTTIVEGDTITQQVLGSERSLLPKTGDEAQMLAVGIGGFALLALGVALIARAMRRNHMGEE